MNATTAFNDYSFANYAVNYNYPDFASWRQAFFSNVETSSNFLQLPNYSLPTAFLDNYKTESEWLDDIQTMGLDPNADPDDNLGYLYYTFRPNNGWDSKQCYLYFDELGVLNENVESIFGIFRTDGTANNETLIRINNTATQDYIRISLTGNTVTYLSNIDGSSYTFATKTVTNNQRFAIGIKLSTISLQNIPNINKFFVDQSLLNIYVGGDGTNTFTGRIYGLGFDAAYNSRKTVSYFDSTGIINENLTTANSLMGYTANYTLKL